MDRGERRNKTQKIIEERLRRLERLPQKNCYFIQILMNEPHRLAKKIDCPEVCKDTSCIYYSRLKQKRSFNKSYKYERR